MRWTSSFAVMSLAAVVFVPSDAPADVTLELRPAAQFVVAGQQTGVEIYAVADPAEARGHDPDCSVLGCEFSYADR
ncbi:MAG: hypothetical protein IIB57_15635 [Planctomycetes bacterium]|nr:hypothetical protein [Planctomycetota bacterium]